MGRVTEFQNAHIRPSNCPPNRPSVHPALRPGSRLGGHGLPQPPLSWGEARSPHCSAPQAFLGVTYPDRGPCRKPSRPSAPLRHAHTLPSPGTGEGATPKVRLKVRLKVRTALEQHPQGGPQM